MCLLTGDNFSINSANPQMLEIWGKEASVIGRSLFEILPEIIEQGFKEILENVYHTGEIFKGNKWPVFLEKYGKYEEYFFTFILLRFIMTIKNHRNKHCCHGSYRSNLFRKKT